MKQIIAVLLAAWLTAGCMSNVPNDDSPGPSPDSRTGMCSDGTPPPCSPPKD